MRKRTLIPSILLVATVAVAAFAGDSIVKIQNDSNWEIHQFFLSPTDSEEWGPDQLGESIIKSGDAYQLHSIECNKYDVKLVDEDGDTCVVGAVKLCSDAEVWTITNEDLLECQKATEENEK